MMKLKNGSNRVAGVAVVAPTINPSMGFSPHTTCPNENTGIVYLSNLALYSVVTTSTLLI